MKKILTLAALVAAMVAGLWLASMQHASADPNGNEWDQFVLVSYSVPATPPGCGFTSQLPWSPCSDNPPVPGVYPNWNPGPVTGPWQTGPWGYEPCTWMNHCGPGA